MDFIFFFLILPYSFIFMTIKLLKKETCKALNVKRYGKGYKGGSMSVLEGIFLWAVV